MSGHQMMQKEELINYLLNLETCQEILFIVANSDSIIEGFENDCLKLESIL